MLQFSRRISLASVLPCLLLALSAGPAVGQQAVIDLKSDWLFARGDDQAWAKVVPASAQPVAVGLNWENAGHAGYDGFGWYFRRLRLTPEVRARDVVLLKLGAIDDADETYVNGQLVGRSGEMPPAKVSAWKDSRTYRVPNEVLRDDNLIAVRVGDFGHNGGMYAGTPALVAFDVVPLSTRGAMLDERTALCFPGEAVLGELPASVLLTREIRKVDLSKPLPDDLSLKPKFTRYGTHYEAMIDVDLNVVDLYGGGEVTGPLLRDGTGIRLWNTDNFAYKTDGGVRLYQSHPWVMGVREDGTAFGVIFDSTWKAELDLKKGIRFAAEGPAFPVIIFERESPQQVMKALAEYTGTMALPPLWALGFQQSKYSYFPHQQVKEVADGFRSRQIPCDVIWMDIDYMDGFRVFTFSPKHFPDPRATNDYLHGQGFKSVWMIDPGVKQDPGFSVYDSGTAHDAWTKTAGGKVFVGDVWPGPCVFPDFTSPRVAEWWAGLYRDFMATGVDGVWNDMNEPAVFNGPDTTMPEDNRHAGGGGLPPGLHRQYHNVYGLLMVKASREGIVAANPTKRPFVLTRANFLGGQRYAATWTGDNLASWDHLKTSIPMSLTLGLSGQPFNGPDIGGYSTPREGMDVELWKHWIALGAFYPFSRSHYAGNDLPFSKEPWSFGDEAEQVARVALQRRYRLLPYLYTLFHEASQSGLPVMRPLFFADARNASLRDEDDAFLLGTDLIVVPRWGENVDLPGGNWAEITLLDGTREDENYQPKYQPKLLQRPGSIIPLGPVVQNTVGYRADPLTLLVHLDAAGQAQGVLYEDAYEGHGCKEGEFAVTRFTARRESDVVVIKSKRESGAMSPKAAKVEVRVIGEPRLRVEVR